MKTLNNTILKVEHFSTIRGEDITEVKIRLKGHVEEKYLQIEVNELDVEQTPRQKIEEEITRLNSYTLNLRIHKKVIKSNTAKGHKCYYENEIEHNKTAIQALQKALTYLN
jgi:hypothetical protein